MSQGKKLVLLGFGIMVLGVLLSRQHEIHSFVTTSDFEYKFLAGAEIFSYVFGVFIALAGCAMTCFKANPRQLILFGAVTAICSAAMFFLSFSVINIHDWTAEVLFLWELSFLVGGISLVVGLVRYLLPTKRLPSRPHAPTPRE
jgi:hypothetical protein